MFGAISTRGSVSIALLSVAVLLLACRGEDAAPASPIGSPLPDVLMEAVRELEGVRLTLSVDRESYSPGDLVTVKAGVENTNDAPVTYTTLNEDGPAISLELISDINGEEPLRGPDDPEVPQTGISSRTLDAGAKLSREVTWDLTLNTFRIPLQAPPGQYVVRAKFLLGEYSGGEEPVSHTAVVTFNVEGSEAIITPEQAIQAAVVMPEVQEWLGGRTMGEPVYCALSKRNAYYAVNPITGELTDSPREIYDAQASAGLPICSAVAEIGAWRILILVRDSPPPSRISAFVDINSGEALRVEEGGLQPADPE